MIQLEDVINNFVYRHAEDIQKSNTFPDSHVDPDNAVRVCDNTES